MAEPLIPRLPDTTKAFQNKYQKLGPILQGAPAPIRNSLVRYDLQRVSQGRNPLSESETVRALQTALTGQAATPAKERSTSPLSLIGNAVNDASMILRSLPRLPGAVLEEVKALPQLPQALADADGPAEMLQAPGVRFLPGAYTLSNILSGQADELMRHPLFTGLDVLPYTGRATASARVGAAKALANDAPLTLGQRAVTGYDNQLASLKRGFARTTPGQLLQQLGGKDARAQAVVKSQHDQWLSETFHMTDDNPLISISPEMRAAAEKASQFQTKWTEIPEARRVELTGQMQASTLPSLDDLSDLERAFVDETRTVADDLARAAEQEGWLQQVGGEWYDTTTARRILGVRKRLTSSQNRIDAKVLPRLARSRDPRTIPIADAIRSGDLATARRLTSNAIRSRSINPELNYAHKALGDALHFQKRYDTLVTSTPPSRFIPAVQERAKQALLEKYQFDPNFPEISQHVLQNTYKMVDGLKEDFADLADDVARTWQDMKAAGIDPVFIHRATPGQAAHLKYPRTVESLRKPTSANARNLYDITPSVQDATVAVPAQALEFLARKSAESMVDTIRTTWGRSQSSVLQDYLPAAQRRAELTPSLDVTGHAQQMMLKEWQQFDPNSFVTWSSPKITNWKEPVMVPRALAKNFERMHKPPEGGFYATMDPIMKVFRTSLLPLSPRWQVYNMVGGAMMAAMENPRILTYLPQAYRLMKHGQVDIQGNVITALPKAIPRGIGTIPREALEWDAMASKDFAARAFQLKSGATLKRLWDSTQAARTAGGKLVEKSYDANAFFDDMYRAAAYLSDFDKSLTKGLSKEAAEKAGISLARKVYQRWDEMTPLERTILRYVMPFYGFNSHITRYVAKYPFDHPVRASIFGTIARKEIEDMGSGLPQKFLSMFFLGDIGEDGKVSSLNVAGMNPFGDAANLFTWSGFLGGSNPVFTSFLESIGVDIQQGGAELYPNLEYDPESGRLRSKSTSFLGNLVQNIVPQSQVLTSFLGSSSEFKELLRTNPEAAKNLVRSQAGLPVLFKDIPVHEEQFRGELSRAEAQADDLSKSYKSGNFKGASRWPGLAPLLKQVSDLQGSEALAPYRPVNAQESPISAINEALVRKNVP